LQEHQHKCNAKKAGNDDVDSPCTEGPLPICWVLSVKRHKINPHKDQGDLETCMIGLIDSTSNDIQLEVNETYNQTLEVFVPFDLSSGFYYLFFQADVGNHISELREGNNFNRQLVTLQEAISTDIAIARVAAFPTELNYGDSKLK